MIKAIDTKKLSEDDLNRAVGDILRVKFLLGLFDHPYIDTTLVSKVFHNEEHQALALKGAEEGICLLKNENEILPIKKDVKSIAVVGPLAASTYMGDYTNDEAKGISILDGLKKRAGKTIQISYALGYAPDSATLSAAYLKEAEDLVRRSDMAIVVLGEDANIDGEGKDRDHLDLDDLQLNLIKKLHETGKPIAVVLFNGRPLTINWVAENIPSIVETWYSGEKGGLAIADVLLGNVNPSGKLPITFPRSVGQIPFYYNHKPTSRHVYVDEADTPLFPFGLGLSYTAFKYTDLQISPSNIPVTGTAS
jgi:beta-glucosidase